MEELIKWVKNHKQFYNKSVLKYLTQEVKDVLLKYNLSIVELCYRIKNNIPFNKVFVCKYCGKVIDFKRAHGGYQTYCSLKCTNNSQEHKDNSKQTCIKKYGTSSYTKTQECKDKIKQTCLKKYNVDSYLKTKDCINKAHTQSIQNKRKDTCIKRYGLEYYSQSQEYKDFIKDNKIDINNKRKHTCIGRYGTDYYLQTQEYKDFMKYHKDEIQDKIKQTCLDKYGSEYYTQTQEFKDKVKNTCSDRYGKPNYTQTDNWKKFYKENKNSILEKQHVTKKANNTFNKSKQEEECYNILLTKFKQEDIIRQYRSKEYPFSCDFYIKSLDLYIEFNGTWTHGPSSYDSNNKEHQELLELWKNKNTNYFKNAIYTWTILDVKKLECFKDNKLNYKIFWNLKEVKNFIGGI